MNISEAESGLWHPLGTKQTSTQRWHWCMTDQVVLFEAMLWGTWNDVGKSAPG